MQIVRGFPHDPNAFTQGLHFLDGKLYESTGLEGRSTLRRVDLASGVVERQNALPDTFFGEGLAQVGQRLFQLTWLNHTVLVWDLATFQKVQEMAYEGEGWGLCYDGKRLVMSNGSNVLSFRDPTTFAKTGEIAIRLYGRPLSQLNELECAQGLVLANVWQNRHIAVIDPDSGEVVSWIDATPLFDDLSRLNPIETARLDVLNGIAYLPHNGHFLLTGKLWPKLYEVTLETTRGQSLQ
jgi:glutaminyl-peptide cyclotransferase